MDTKRQGEMASGDLFSILQSISGRTWSWFALGSILLSLYLFLTGRRGSALFIGQWPPTLILLSLFYRLLRPSQENPQASMQRTMKRVKAMTQS